MCRLLLSTTLALAQTKSLQEIRIHYEEAGKAFRANQFDIAEREFKEILRIDPPNAEARANLGFIAFRKGDDAKAVREFEAALRLNPTLWNAEAFWGICENRLGSIRHAPTWRARDRHLHPN